jgi:hypothetical protein
MLTTLPVHRLQNFRGWRRHALRLHIAPTIDDGDLPPEKAIVGPKQSGVAAPIDEHSLPRCTDLLHRPGSAFERSAS